MRRIEKNNWKQKPSTSPSYINRVKTGLKIAAVAVGFYLWGSDFIWVVLGLYVVYDILVGILSFLISLISLIGFFYFLFTHIF